MELPHVLIYQTILSERAILSFRQEPLKAE
jgi:hypothetical protein